MSKICREDILQVVEGVVKEYGLELYDLYIPPNSSGNLRIYVDNPPASDSLESLQEDFVEEGDKREDKKKEEVSLEDCVKVSKRLSYLDEEIGGIIPEFGNLEVSSPGIERRLRTLKHYQGVIGQKIKITHNVDGNKRSTLKGKLNFIKGEILNLSLQSDPEKKGKKSLNNNQVDQNTVEVGFNSIVEGRVVL